jgi:hypothetical protein
MHTQKSEPAEEQVQVKVQVQAGRTSRAKATKVLTKDELFFFDHAGYSYKTGEETAQQGRIRCASSLAHAEQLADRLGWTFEWEYDQDPDLSWMTPEELAKDHEVLGCILKDADGQVLESLWGIVDADANYRRVVEAELADQAEYELDHEIEVLDAH